MNLKTAKTLAVAATAAALATTAQAEAAIPASAYVQEGLVAQWDGIENFGVGQHGDVAEQGWKDLVGGCVLNGNIASGGSIETGVDHVKLLKASLRTYDDGGTATEIVKIFGSPSNTIELVGRDSTRSGHTWISIEDSDNSKDYFFMWSNAYNLQLGQLRHYGDFATQLNLVKNVGDRFTCVAVADKVKYGGKYKFYSDGVWVCDKNVGLSEKTTAVGGISLNATSYSSNPGSVSSPQVYAVRIYKRALHPKEIALNAALDKVRFDGESPETAFSEGWSYDKEVQKVRYDVVLRQNLGGNLVVDGVVFTEDFLETKDFGTSFSHDVIASPHAGYLFKEWTGDVDAIVEGDIYNPSVKVESRFPVALTPVYVCDTKELYVSGSGADGSGRGGVQTPYRTIQYAVRNAREGQEIRIAGGVYRESVTNRSDQGGWHGLQFVGSWKSDFSARDLRNCRTIVRPPEAFLNAVPCFHLMTTTNRFDGIDVTGGSHGFYQYYGWTGSQWIGGGSGVHTMLHCAVTNNAYGVYSLWRGFAVASSLFAENGTGFYQAADGGTAASFNNCTFAKNADYALQIGAKNTAAFTARNCVFNVNGYVLRSVSKNSMVFSTCCFGPELADYFHEDTLTPVFNGNCVYKDPLLGDGYELCQGSPALKTGEDVSTITAVDISGDFYGLSWDGEYDLGCFKSEYEKPVEKKFSMQYVSPTGDDGNDGATPETARVSVQGALDHISPTGVVRILNGRYVGSLSVKVAGVVVEGESRDGAIIEGSNKSALPSLDVQAPDVTVRNLTIENGSSGVYVRESEVADNCMITNCVIRGNGYGINVVQGTGRAGYKTTISHCWITNNTNHGLNIPSAYRMDNCLIARNGGYGVNGTQLTGYDTSIAINCTIADNRGAYGVVGAGSYVWAGAQSFYDCVLSGHKTCFYRSGAGYGFAGRIDIYNCVLGNATNYCAKASEYRIVADNQTLEVDDVKLETRRTSRLYWPLPGSPVLGRATSRNGTLPVSVTTDLKGSEINLRRWFADGCFQPLGLGFLLFVQ